MRRKFNKKKSKNRHANKKSNWVSLTVLAKKFGLSMAALRSKLIEAGIIFNENKCPADEYVKSGYAHPFWNGRELSYRWNLSKLQNISNKIKCPILAEKSKGWLQLNNIKIDNVDNLKELMSAANLIDSADAPTAEALRTEICSVSIRGSKVLVYWCIWKLKERLGL